MSVVICVVCTHMGRRLPRGAPGGHTSHETNDRTAHLLGIWRVCLFTIMCYQWVYHLPKYVPDILEDEKHAAVDRMFAYDQFEWLLESLPTTEEGRILNYQIGLWLGIMAALGMAFRVSSIGFTIMFGRQFLFTACAFTNHDYFFLLLLTITSVSGANSAYSLDQALWGVAPSIFAPATGDTVVASRDQDVRQQQGRQCALVILRSQVATVYFFASLWKIHPDWLSGHIVRGIFLGFEDQGVARGVPWHALEAHIPHLFVRIYHVNFNDTSDHCVSVLWLAFN